MTTALLVVDVQEGFITGKGNPHETGGVLNADEVLGRVQTLIARARAVGVPVIFVETLDAPEYDGPLHPALEPMVTDFIVGKYLPDAFAHTILEDMLQEMLIEHVVVCGFQTEMCVDATVRHAWALDYHVTLAADAHSTFDPAPDAGAPVTAAQMIAHHNKVLRAYARVVPTDEITFAIEPA